MDGSLDKLNQYMKPHGQLEYIKIAHRLDSFNSLQILGVLLGLSDPTPEGSADFFTADCDSGDRGSG